MRHRRPLAAPAALTAVAVAASLAAAGCSSAGAGAGSGSASGSSAAGLTGSITVLAAASLTTAFTSLGRSFEAAHPGSHVRFSFGASSTLARQVGQGAPADVFASASTKNMQQVVDAHGADAAAVRVFAKNAMEIAVPPRNPAHIAGLADLGRRAVKVALCQPEVPCGATAQQVFANAGVAVRAVTLEQDVKATLAKVELGEVDAGVVYVTDIRAANGKVTGVPVPDAVNASTEYPVVALRNSKRAPLARAFVEYVLGPAGQAVLRADGFEAP